MKFKLLLLPFFIMSFNSIFCCDTEMKESVEQIKYNPIKNVTLWYPSLKWTLVKIDINKFDWMADFIKQQEKQNKKYILALLYDKSNKISFFDGVQLNKYIFKNLDNYKISESSHLRSQVHPITKKPVTQIQYLTISSINGTEFKHLCFISDLFSNSRKKHLDVFYKNC